MDAKTDAAAASTALLNTLLTFWGMSNAAGSGRVDGQMKRFEQFARDMQKTCDAAQRSQMDSLLTSNDRLMHSFQALFRSRAPQDVIAAESEILATVFEGASLQAKNWLELTQNIEHCCSRMARDTAEGLRHPS